jgi:hypothetical protein
MVRTPTTLTTITITKRPKTWEELLAFAFAALPQANKKYIFFKVKLIL